MREVHVAGVGMSKFGKMPETRSEVLARTAVLEALKDADVGREWIQATFVGSAFGGGNVGQRIAKYTGMDRMPITNVENACASGSTAFRLGWLAVASGQFDVVLVAGVDQLTVESGPLPITAADLEGYLGINLPAVYAMRARAYLDKHDVGVEDLAAVVVKNRRHASLNPDAHLRDEVTVEEVLDSRPVADPLTLYQCCPRSDGAAAAVLCAADGPLLGSSRRVRVLASQLCSGRFIPGYRDMTVPEVSYRAAEEAYEMAGLGPEDIDVAEVHDAFSISELLYYEALQFCPPGDAVKFLHSGATTFGGQVPVNTSGGLLAKGHPPGATGIAQLVEIVKQLRGEAGSRQVESARIGLGHCTGGGVSGYDHSAAAINILARH